MNKLTNTLDTLLPENILARKILLAFIFVMILALNPAWKSSPFYISEMAIFVAAIFPTRRTFLFVVLSASFFLMPIEISNLYRNTSVVNWALIPKEKATFWIRLISLIVFVFISYLLKIAAEKKSRPILFLFMVYLIFCLSLAFIPDYHNQHILLVVFYIISIRFFHLIYNFRHQKVFRKMKTLDFFANLSFPFPVAAFMPIPIPSLLHSLQSNSDEDYLKNQKDGIFLALLTCFIALGFSWFMKTHSQDEMIQLLTSHRGPKNHFSISSINFYKEITDTYSLFQRWQYAFLHFLFYIIPFSIMGGLIVSYYRICGFKVTASTSFPYGAKSFTEYLKRINFYISECIRDCFVYPLFSLLTYFSDVRKRVFVSVLLGVSVGGLFFQFLVKPRPDIRINFINHIQHSFVFFIILSILVLITLVLEEKDSKKKVISAPKLVFKFICYLIMSTSIYTLVEFHGSSVYVNDIQSRIVFLKSLFLQ